MDDLSSAERGLESPASASGSTAGKSAGPGEGVRLRLNSRTWRMRLLIDGKSSSGSSAAGVSRPSISLASSLSFPFCLLKCSNLLSCSFAMAVSCDSLVARCCWNLLNSLFSSDDLSSNWALCRASLAESCSVSRKRSFSLSASWDCSVAWVCSSAAMRAFSD